MEHHCTKSEATAREQRGFPPIEASLPRHVGSRFNIPVLDNLSSFLFGSHNPLARAADPATDAVWLFDNTAYRPALARTGNADDDGGNDDESRPWEAEFVAAYFARDSGQDISRWVADIANKLGLAGSTTTSGGGGGGEGRERVEDVIARRLQPLVDTIRPARYIDVVWNGTETRTLGPGEKNAISSQVLAGLGDGQDGDALHTAAVDAALTPHGPMTTYFAAPEGWTVISDIDDSIKITLTSSPLGILRSTFVDEPAPVPDMPRLYAHVARTLSPNWFYLSASPYSLQPFLRPFLRAHYPAGTLILRDASWMDLAGLLRSLTQGTQAYKTARIEKIRSWLPRRKVLCVGDSTQSDPEAYGAAYRAHPGWVRAIFIRRVVGVAGMEGTGKNDPARFEAAFEGVPRSVWRVFENPDELDRAVESLVTI